LGLEVGFGADFTASFAAGSCAAASATGAGGATACLGTNDAAAVCAGFSSGGTNEAGSGIPAASGIETGKTGLWLWLLLESAASPRLNLVMSGKSSSGL